ncbi:MAG: hypothetical protein M3O26_03235 [Pseudomonadota bacterium]|nr:hypothetical protein [Pseudomonadota bacterium]
MQTVDDALGLLKRQADLESAMKQVGGNKITEEQELPLCPADRAVSRSGARCHPSGACAAPAYHGGYRG